MSSLKPFRPRRLDSDTMLGTVFLILLIAVLIGFGCLLGLIFGWLI